MLLDNNVASQMLKKIKSKFVLFYRRVLSQVVTVEAGPLIEDFLMLVNVVH